MKSDCWRQHRNITLNAAFLAAATDEPVGMPHILQAATSEYIKLERPLPEREVKGWVPMTDVGAH